MKKSLIFIYLLVIFLFSCTKNEEPLKDAYIDYAYINDRFIVSGTTLYDVPTDSVVISLDFSAAYDITKLNPQSFYLNQGIDTAFDILPSDDKTILKIRLREPLEPYTEYKLLIGAGDQLGFHLTTDNIFTFITALDTTPRFPKISDDSLMTLVQRKTFDYFYGYAHPVSGMARERFQSGETVTTGGTGFGISALPVAIERGFISRNEGYLHLKKIVDFLSLTTTDRFHGVYPHWMNGTNGKVIPFSTKDNGGDLVETAFLMQGLLTAQSYFKNGNADEKALCTKIQQLWESVEWNWYTQNQQVLYWHWSSVYNFGMNMTISGWNEGLIVYVLAASSPTYPITKTVYDAGWAKNGTIKNGNNYYNIRLPLGESRGGPLFFTHYSFLGLNPTQLKDQYANYWEQNTAHARINHAYCVANPKKFFGYGPHCWGLTASDIPNGYTASSPNNDVGVIAPTAALSSFPYTPVESMQALKFFYYVLGDKIWGTYGFKDAFSLSKAWFATSFLAIDQGPIVVMMENYRSGLPWNLFMQQADIQNGLKKLGFEY